MSSFIWDGEAPFFCGGDDDVTVKGVKAEFTAGTAMIAIHKCRFTCIDCQIKAPVAIEAAGNAVVTIVHGDITGTELLAKAHDNAIVSIVGNATTKGAVKQSDNAKVR